MSNQDQKSTRLGTMVFTIANELVNHCGKKLEREVIDEITRNLTLEMCQGPTSWAFSDKDQPGTCQQPQPDVVMAVEFDRVTAERDALQQRLNAADQRIDELTTQQTESRVITLSGCEFSEHELLRTAVRMVTGTSRRGTQRWVAMKDAFCCGSGVAHALCRRFGFDPDETVKP